MSTAERLTQLLAGAIELGFDGLNVTHPVKQAMVPLVDEARSGRVARSARSTPCSSATAGPSGHNTDVTGFRRSFTDGLPGRRPRPRRPARRRWGRHRRGARAGRPRRRRLLVVDPDAARAARARWRRWTAARPTHRAGRQRPRTSWRPAIGRSAGLVNATPMGMAAHPGLPGARRSCCAGTSGSPTSSTARSTLRCSTPPATPGCTVLNGAGMAVHQAADAFELITGRPPTAPRCCATSTSSWRPRPRLDPTRDTTGERNR